VISSYTEMEEELWNLEARTYQQYANIRPLYWALMHHRNIRGERMFFTEGAYYLWDLYRRVDDIHHMVVEKSVQCGLSELFIVLSHLEAGERGLSVMYVLPKYELRNRFVNNRIYKLHKRVPHYEALVQEAQTKVHRTSLMHFGKGTLAYVGSNVSDEFIEIPVDSAYVDEVDRCNLANLQMLPDRLTASPYQYQREISNPTVEGYGIDERYGESSKGTWKIKCDHCGEWFTPDFFRHVVEEVGTNAYRPRDTSADPDPLAKGEIRLIHDCGKPVDRLKRGEWVHEYPSRTWQGFRISKLFARLSPKGTLRSLYHTWSKAVGNELKTQIFYNSDLGLPFSSRGARISRGMLNACRRNYEYPPKVVSNKYGRFMGVDVGEHLHVILRERIKMSNGVIVYRLIGTWVLPGFSQLSKIIREWQPKSVVIDSMPEIHKVMDLKDEFHFVWSSRFAETATSLVKNDSKRELNMNRTALLDYIRQHVELELLELPLNAEFLNDGEYYAHMMASTRILEANETNPEKSRFVWREGSKPDHFFLAEAYAFQASMIMPEHGVFEFFEQEANAMASHTSKRRITGSGDEVDEEKRQKLADMAVLTPNAALSVIAEKNKPVLPKPKVDDEKIGDAIEYMYEAQKYVDIYLVSKGVGENESDVRRVLLTMGFKESRIKGQYVK
jgi:hypothetical protein